MNSIPVYGPVSDLMALGFCTTIDGFEEKGIKDVTLVLNSPGGSVSAINAMMAKRRQTNIKVNIAVCGQACSAAALFTLTCKDDGGVRAATENSTFMFHQPRGIYTIGFENDSLDIEFSDEFKDLQIKSFIKYSNMSEEDIRKELAGDFYISAQKAKELGLIDLVIKV